jgi:hypothetical protein
MVINAFQISYDSIQFASNPRYPELTGTSQSIRLILGSVRSMIHSFNLFFASN